MLNACLVYSSNRKWGKNTVFIIVYKNIEITTDDFK